MNHARASIVFLKLRHDVDCHHFENRIDAVQNLHRQSQISNQELIIHVSSLEKQYQDYQETFSEIRTRFDSVNEISTQISGMCRKIEK